jgi:hypothetical protein
MPYPGTAESGTADVPYCPRCDRRDHLNLVVYHLPGSPVTSEVYDENGNSAEVDFTDFALCPVTGAPILVNFREVFTA